MQFNSLFEYLERRFDKTARLLASFIFAMSLILIIPMVIYIPSLAFKQVTGISMYFLAPVICGVCIFYTSLGGLKAVVWSDALQSGCTLTALIVVSYLGVMSVGGLKSVLEINEKGERLETFNLDVDPFARNTFWTTTFGSLPTWLMAFAAHPSTAQRYISVSSIRRAETAVGLMVIGIVIFKSLSTFTGLIIYAKYHDCDPVVTGQVDKPGQLLPFYIMDVAKDYPGLAGLFLSGVVSTALSTMSTCLNTVAGTIYEDFLKPLLPQKPSDKTANLIMKVTTVILGIKATALVFVVEKLGTIMQVAVSLQGVTCGVSLFMFTFGMLVPWGNAAGAKIGSIAGLIATSWLVVGAQVYIQSGDIEFGSKPRSFDNCPFNFSLPHGINSTHLGYGGVGTKVMYSDSVPDFYKISYLYYSLIGLLVAMVVGCIVSLMTGVQDPSQLDQRLFIPQLRKKHRLAGDKVPIELYSRVPTAEMFLK